MKMIVSCTARMFAVTLTLAFIASLSVSVDAIRCHQCNSHLQEDCTGLRLSTPRAPPDNYYLRECADEHDSHTFCRKTVTKIDATGEHRIVRSCGWIKGESNRHNFSCFDADNEGFHQKICACSSDGCNAATTATGNTSLQWILTSVAVMFSLVVRRRN